MKTVIFKILVALFFNWTLYGASFADFDFKPPLSRLFEAIEKDQPQTCQHLRSIGIGINQPYGEYSCCLDAAIKNQSSSVLMWLLNRKEIQLSRSYYGDLEVKADDDIMEVFTEAMEDKLDHIMSSPIYNKKILDRAFDRYVSFEHYQIHPLFRAILKKNLPAVQWIVNKGVDVNLMDESYLSLPNAHAFPPNLESAFPNTTAVSLAAQCGYQKIVEFLLEHGADPYIQDEKGMDALQHALIRGYGAIAQAIKEHKSRIVRDG